MSSLKNRIKDSVAPLRRYAERLGVPPGRVIRDAISARLLHGYTLHDYIFGDTYYKRGRWRRRIVTDHRIIKLMKKLDDPTQVHLLQNKVDFMRHFGPLTGRSFFTTEGSTPDDLAAWIKAHPDSLIKPIWGQQGKGITRTPQNPDIPALWDELEKTESYLDEMIVQHPEMAAVSSSVNSMRAYTLMGRDGKARVLRVVPRFGRPGALIDNFHQGVSVIRQTWRPALFRVPVTTWI